MNTILVANIFFLSGPAIFRVDSDPAKLSFHTAAADRIRHICTKGYIS
jgi:hypothetical protein